VQVTAVLIHVPEPPAGLDWYQAALSGAVRRQSADGFTFLQVGAVAVEVVPTDDKVTVGAAGSVVYWSVPDLATAVRRLCGLGASLYRGPLAIEHGLGMCQVRDPWGNCLGLRGRWPDAEPISAPDGD
jgi:uncharacterized protein